MDKNKNNGKMLLVFFTVATTMILNMYNSIYTEYELRSYEEEVVEEQSTESTEINKEKQMLAITSNTLDIDINNLSSIKETDFIMYETTSESEYVNTLENIKNTNQFYISDNGIKRYTWYIIFKFNGVVV